VPQRPQRRPGIAELYIGAVPLRRQAERLDKDCRAKVREFKIHASVTSGDERLAYQYMGYASHLVS
jgi:hypothetical protein